MTSSELAERVLISAPGKVILFGEHSVVYGKLAVAASLGLRSYLYLEKRADDKVELVLPDVGVDKSWKLKDILLRFDVPEAETRHPNEILKLWEDKFVQPGIVNQFSLEEKAILAFIYLLLTLEARSAHPLTHGFTLSVRAFLPVGAGLGSSASYSVVLATALLILTKNIPVEFADSPEREKHLDLINTYAFKAEQVIHGNPSGVDNAVATFGGAKTFVRGQGFSTLEGFSSLRLLLTNTKVPRSTSQLVANVSEKKTKYPEIIDPVLDDMDTISIRCRDAFQNKDVDREALLNELEELVVQNHALLNTLGVSHPSLEKVRSITAEAGFKTKLTGAGGGGCAVTLIRDDASQEALEKAMAKLKEEGFDCYQTSIGGVGVAAMSLGENKNAEWFMETSRTDLEKYQS